MTTIQASVRDRIKELRRVRASELLPSPKNWRRHPKAQSDALLGMLSEIGFADALLARETSEGLQLIDGHLRADLMGDTMVPVLVLDVTEAEADKLLLTLDPLAGMANQDSDALQALLRDTSFESEAVNAMLEALVNGETQPLPPLPESAPDPGPELDKAAELQAKWGTALGQLWEIPSLTTPGKAHRLLCGDSAKAEDVARLMQGEQAALLLTDPPYAVDYVEKARDMNQRGYVHSRATLSAAIQGDRIEAGQEEGLWRDVFSLAFTALKDDSAWYIWHAPGRAMLSLHKVLADLGMLYHQTIIWVKNNFVIGRCDYQWKHEPCYYGWRQGHRPPFYGEKSQTTIWEEARDTSHPDHPTQKPVAIFRPPMTNHLLTGQIAYDPFLGSGTTMVAAEQTGRICYGCEIEPRYVAVALERLAGMGLSPHLVGD